MHFSRGDIFLSGLL